MERRELQSTITDTDQRGYIKICVLLGKGATDIHRDLVRALGVPAAYSYRTVRDWVRRYEGGGGGIITERLNIMRNLSNRWVHADDVVKQRYSAVCDNLRLLAQFPQYLRQTLAVDESWVCLYRPPEGESIGFEVTIEEEPPPNVEYKRILIVAMGWDGIAYWHLYEEGESITAERYHQFLSDVVLNYKSERNITDVLLLHDRIEPHGDPAIVEFLERHDVLTWNQPPHSPDLSPPKYNCFEVLNVSFGGEKFPNWPDLYAALEIEIQDGNDRGMFQGVRELGQRWRNVQRKHGKFL